MADFASPSLLPPPLARDLTCRATETLGARMSAIDLTPLLVYDFDTVAASALASLAEQLRVLGDAGWNLATTEAQQRALLKSAIKLHRMRGTSYAVTRALEILGVNADTVEWFEDTPQRAPYTFAVDIDTTNQPADAPLITLDRWAQIIRVVNYWKNARSGFSVRLSSTGLALGMGVVMVACGEESEAITANFDGDAIGLALPAATVATGTERQIIGATFA
ncbi:phage tail protein I [Paraburkholderia sp. BR14263]|uniref:phage tail protein I n=1 Tax=unclassified Paraburkholderia TaxID=2615204 RepID=UPI0034CEC744